MELQHALRVGEGAFEFGDLSRWQVEHFSLDVGRLHLAIFDFRRILPVICRLRDPVVLDHQPFELSESRALQFGVKRRGRVLADADHPLHLARVHRRKHRHMGMIAENFRVPVVAVLVVFRCRVAVD